jgi:hypothetical protein
VPLLRENIPLLDSAFTASSSLDNQNQPHLAKSEDSNFTYPQYLKAK